MLNKNNKRLTFDLPKKLYRMFRRSKFRQLANTDSEGLRSLIANAIQMEQESQDKKCSA